MDAARTNLFDRRTASRPHAAAAHDDEQVDGTPADDEQPVDASPVDASLVDLVGTALGVDELIDLVGRLEPCCLLADLGPCGTDRTPQGRQELAVRRLSPDPRGGAASMFGLTVPEHCRGVAVTMVGTLGSALGRRPVDSIEHPSISGRLDTAVRLDLAVARTGATRARVTERSGDGPGAVLIDDDHGDGMLVDALHRVLGVATRGPAPSFARLVLGMWSRHVLLHVEQHGSITWLDAAALHPAAVPTVRTPASPEVLATACATVREDIDWERIRTDTAAGRCAAPELAPGDAAWMDAPMFGRWCVESYPPPALCERALRVSRSSALEGFREVVRLTRAADADHGDVDP